ncbi:MAG: YebC/PmpR family DNA-binding transcriptional regulator [Patescibacteria group bacterium]
MSGHNKWSQIKHKKGITDAKKGKIFSGLVREVMIACKTGGNNPNSNTRLRAAIERARGMGVPKNNIERAVSRGSGTKEGSEFKEFLYEATGPCGIAILIEGITDNTNRSISEIKHLLNTHGGHIADPNSLLWNFQKIGILEVSKEQNSRMLKDDIELAFIEAGARDFFSTDDAWIIETEFAACDHVRKQLEQRGVAIRMSEHDYKPMSTILLDPQTETAAELLINTLTEHEDVREVYTNIQNSV